MNQPGTGRTDDTAVEADSAKPEIRLIETDGEVTLSNRRRAGHAEVAGHAYAAYGATEYTCGTTRGNAYIPCSIKD
ncbi:MAG: hypothetical protein JO362_02620 [Streptomycetaceae bacterium]|nr:hypothetical protein [Streptomycetaceae bacterium]